MMMLILDFAQDMTLILVVEAHYLRRSNTKCRVKGDSKFKTVRPLLDSLDLKFSPAQIVFRNC